MNDALAPKSGIALSLDQKLSWLRLIRSDNVGPATFLQLIQNFGTAANALEALPDLIAHGRGGKGGKTIKIASTEDAEQEIERIHKINARLVCLGEPSYPPALRDSDAPPPVLTVAGNDDALTRKSVAFVGSRNASIAGTKLTKSLASEAGSAGYLVVSGLARGIDTAAHEASLTTGTVAVFAGGIDIIYPEENAKLAHSITNGDGAVISEMPFGWKPRAQDFPRRNRIVAGMCLGLVVVEAAKRSGSLISARLANEMGRLVFAVPGSPLDPRSEGTNFLIKQGAQLITDATDILSALKPMVEVSKQSAYELAELEATAFTEEPSQSDRERLADAIGHTPTHVDDLIRFTGLAPGTVQLLLLELEMAGRLDRPNDHQVSIV